MTAQEFEHARPLPSQVWPNIIGWALAAVMLVASLVLFAPSSVGGRTSYVVTQGASMLPHFRAGALVLTRSEPSYQVGDVVAYHNRQLRSVVMHRIVATDGTRFVMQGDNNNFRDSYHPNRADIVGKQWIYWRAGGIGIRVLRTPSSFAIILAALGFIAGTGVTPTRRSRHAH